MVPEIELALTNENGEIEPTVGHWITSRYRIVSLLGEGTFAKVVKVYDNEDAQVCKAIKVVKNKEIYRTWSLKEVSFLRDVKKFGEDRRVLFIDILEEFDYNGHLCISFPVYGRNLFRFLQDNGYRAFPIDQAQKICYQLLSAIEYLHDNCYIHTDIKPENILIKNDKYSLKNDAIGSFQILHDPSVVLSDFNSLLSTEKYNANTGLIQTSNYRAPEVILGLPWTNLVDIWSVGCVFVDVFMGHTLLGNCTDGEGAQNRMLLLDLITTFIGPIPSVMICNSSFEDLVTYEPIRYNTITTKDDLIFIPPVTVWTREHCLLRTVINRALTIDPIGRPSASKLLTYPVFKKFEN